MGCQKHTVQRHAGWEGLGYVFKQFITDSKKTTSFIKILYILKLHQQQTLIRGLVKPRHTKQKFERKLNPRLTEFKRKPWSTLRNLVLLADPALKHKALILCCLSTRCQPHPRKCQDVRETLFPLTNLKSFRIIKFQNPNISDLSGLFRPIEKEIVNRVPDICNFPRLLGCSDIYLKLNNSHLEKNFLAPPAEFKKKKISYWFCATLVKWLYSVVGNFCCG